MEASPTTPGSGPPTGRRRQKKDGTRRRLLDAATEVFTTGGYAGPTLDEIAGRAGLTKGAVYSNFGSKMDLALAVLERRIHSPLAIFERVDRTGAPEEQLRQAGLLMAEELDAAAMWFLLELECTVAAIGHPDALAKLRAHGEAMRGALAHALEERFRDQGVAGVSAASTAAALVAVVNGAALERLKDPEAMPADLIAGLIAAVQSAVPPTMPTTRH